MSGWYVVQVQSGREDAMVAQIRQFVDERALEACFAPRWETQRKIHGQWKTVVRNLIPGYVMAVANDPVRLEQGLRRVPGFTKLLRSGEVLAPLSEDEVAWFETFMQREDHTVPLSTAVKEGDQVIITDGPLKLHQSKIVRIDRRKSTAYVQISILGRTKEVPVGLRVLAKKPDVD